MKFAKHDTIILLSLNRIQPWTVLVFNRIESNKIESWTVQPMNLWQGKIIEIQTVQSMNRIEPHSMNRVE